MLRRRVLPAFACVLLAASAEAQAPDAAALRARLRSRDADIQRVALLELGRLERPSLIPVIVPLLRSGLPEIRAQAADAIGQSARGWLAAPPTRRDSVTIEPVIETLIARLKVDDDSGVRAAITETIGRLPYMTPEQVGTAAAALIQVAPGETVADRLGIAKGLEALVRLNRPLASSTPQAADADIVARLRNLAASDPSRDARVRRLSLTALITLDAVDDSTLARAADDIDAQVRRLAMRAAALRAASRAAKPVGQLDAVVRETLTDGLTDDAPMVRLEALGGAPGETACPAARAAAADRDLHVALLALDRLGRCADDAALLERTVNDLSEAGTPRGWHKAAHALLALATVSPERARAALPQFVGSKNWPLRMYAARSASVLKERSALERLGGDENESVKDAAIEGLAALGDRAAPQPRRRAPAPAELSVDNLRGLASLHARVVVRDVGVFEMALLASEAPEVVARIVSAARSGYYDGLVVSRVLPNLVAGTGAGVSDAGDDVLPEREEVGRWPHVRGAVGTALKAGDGLNAGTPFFIDLVDNPQFDHQHTVFGQILSGMDVVDALLEGDVIERVDIVKP